MTRMGVLCSHCHEITFADTPPYPMCKECGHLATKPRYLCNCDRCKHMRANLEAKGERDRREPPDAPPDVKGKGA